MKVIEPSVELLVGNDTGIDLLKRIEAAGRTCYKSESSITDDSAKEFVAKIIKNGHESVIEHEKLSFRVICDRGVTHEIVRHRLASYSQESTRYVRYDGNMEFIRPLFWSEAEDKYKLWYQFMAAVEIQYKNLLHMGASPQEARSLLPNSLKTEIVITMNLRELRHFFRLRCAKAAHPQMQQVAKMMLFGAIDYIPVVFDEFKEYLESK